MKPMKSRIILMFAVLTVLCSCQVAELSSGRHGVGDVALSIDEAVNSLRPIIVHSGPRRSVMPCQADSPQAIILRCGRMQSILY